jgi:hypothetical protein
LAYSSHQQPLSVRPRDAEHVLGVAADIIPLGAASLAGLEAGDGVRHRPAFMPSRM